MARPTNITLCSFCGKSHAEVKKLIQGPGVALAGGGPAYYQYEAHALAYALEGPFQEGVLPARGV